MWGVMPTSRGVSGKERQRGRDGWGGGGGWGAVGRGGWRWLQDPFPSSDLVTNASAVF